MLFGSDRLEYVGQLGYEGECWMTIGLITFEWSINYGHPADSLFVVCSSIYSRYPYSSKIIGGDKT